MDLPIASARPQQTSPVEVMRPTRQMVPVVFASPHSGRAYPEDFLAAARLDPLRLRRSEDSFVDELFATAPDQGAPLICATFPRAFCDVNREAWELDPAMFADPLPSWVNTSSARVCAGLGTIARIVASGETIYRAKLSFAEAERRISHYWQPFHETLQALIAGTRAMFGTCLLVDCHSMPSHGNGRPSAKSADFVLGDAHGTTCNPAIAQILERTLAELGYIVRRNDPYAGGYITRQYGRPREHVHVIQLEIARELYMDESRIERLPRFGAVQQDMAAFVRTVAHVAGSVLRPD